MKTLKIITPEDQTLRQKAVPVERIKDMGLQQLIDRMIATMREANGAGLAAPQVGESIRLAVIETPAEVDDDGNEIPDSRKLFTIINPEITWSSRKQVDGIEGCLSIPGYVGEVSRHQAVHVTGLDRAGKKLNLKLKGWVARIFQHEIDHLDGVLYTDKLTSPEHFWTEEEFEELQKEDEEG